VSQIKKPHTNKLLSNLNVSQLKILIVMRIRYLKESESYEFRLSVRPEEI